MNNTNPIPEIKIRKAKSKDVGILYKLYKSEKAINDFAGLHTISRFKSLIKSKDSLLIVAESHGELAGALDAEFYDESGFSYFANIVVSKGYRRRGIGVVLMKEYEKIAKKRRIKIILGLVYDWNRSMHKLMKKTRYKNNGNLIEYLKKLR